MKCVQCGSVDLIKGGHLVDRGEVNVPQTLEFEIQQSPKGIIRKRGVRCPTGAIAHADCGFVLIQLNNEAIHELKEASQAQEILRDMKTHPDYREFLKEDPIRKHLFQEDLVRHFPPWIEERES